MLPILLCRTTPAGISLAQRNSVFDSKGNTAGDQKVTLLSLNQASGGKVTSAGLAPIVAFQLNFVDYLGGGNTVLSSGAGWITYGSSKTMTPLGSVPACIDWNFHTLETANSSYGLLPSNPNGMFTQTFQRAADGKVIRMLGQINHKTE